MADHLGEHHKLERKGPKGDDLQAAILVILVEHAPQREHGGEQGADPEHARRDALQERALRPDAEREERHGDDEEHHRHQAADAAAHGEAEVAPDQAEKGRHHSP